VETKQGYLSAPIAEASVPDYVVAELRYESPVAFTASSFAAPAAAAPQAEKLNNVLAGFKIKSMRSHFQLPPAALKARVAIAATLPTEPDPAAFAEKGMDDTFLKSGFVEIVPKDGADAKKLADALSRQGAVWQAFVAPRPVPAMPSGAALGSRNFEPSQGYLHAAPNGIGAAEVWGLAGAVGKGVTICDIEGNWNRQHEDLPKGIKLLGGTVIDDQG
jgi:hypothetical protein